MRKCGSLLVLTGLLLLGSICGVDAKNTEYRETSLIEIQLREGVDKSDLTDEQKAYYCDKYVVGHPDGIAATSRGDVFLLFSSLRIVKVYDKVGKYVDTIRWNRDVEFNTRDRIVADGDDVYLASPCPGEKKKLILIDKERQPRTILLDDEYDIYQDGIKNGRIYSKSLGKVKETIESKSGADTPVLKPWPMLRIDYDDGDAELQIGEEEVVRIEFGRKGSLELLGIDGNGWVYLLFGEEDRTASYLGPRGDTRFGQKFWIDILDPDGNAMGRIDLKKSVLRPRVMLTDSRAVFQLWAEDDIFKVTKWSLE